MKRGDPGRIGTEPVMRGGAYFEVGTILTLIMAVMAIYTIIELLP